LGDTKIRTDLTHDDAIYTSTHLKRLPEGWFDKICQAAMRGRSRQVLEFIGEVQESHAGLAKVLTDITRDFQIEKIPPLLNKIAGDKTVREKHNER
jgi:hypothetical protein